MGEHYYLAHLFLISLKLSLAEDKEEDDSDVDLVLTMERRHSTSLSLSRSCFISSDQLMSPSRCSLESAFLLHLTRQDLARKKDPDR